MAAYNSDQYSDSVAVPVTKAQPNDHSGRVRIARATYLTDATTAPVAGDSLNLFKLPQGAKVHSMEVIVPASFVTSSAKIGYGTFDAAGTVTAVDDDRWGSGKDLSSAGRVQFITVAADAAYETTSEVAVLLTFVTGDPAEAKTIEVICTYTVD